MLRTVPNLGRRGGHRAFAPTKSSSRRSKKKSSLKTRRSVKGSHAPPMSARREMNEAMDLEAFESFKVKGRDFQLPPQTKDRLLGIEEKWGEGVYDELVREMLYGVRPEVGEGERGRYLAIAEGKDVGVEALLSPTTTALGGISPNTSSLAASGGVMSTEGRRILRKHSSRIIKALESGNHDKINRAVNTTASVVKHELIKHYRGRKGKLAEVVRFVGDGLDLPKEVVGEIMKVEDVITGISMAVGGGGIGGLEDLGGVGTWVWNLDYKSISNEEAKAKWEERFQLAVKREEEGTVDAAVAFGYKMLGKDSSNLTWVRDNIVYNRELQEISPQDFGVKKLSLRVCSYTGEAERAMNVLESMGEDRDESCYEEVLNAVRRSVRYDFNEVAKDVEMAQYYCKMVREVVGMMGEEEAFQVYRGGAWRGALGAAGALGDWDTAKAIFKAREISMRDYCNEEGMGEELLLGEGDGGESAMVTLEPDTVRGEGVVGWEEADYAAAISASLTKPIINNIYGVVSDEVCVRNALLANVEKAYDGINQQTVPGLSGMETSVASMDWDGWDDQKEGRANRGKLKRRRFEGLKQDNDLGTGRWPIAEGWALDDVLNKDRWEEKEFVKELVGGGDRVSWEKANMEIGGGGGGDEEEMNIKQIEEELRREYLGREGDLLLEGGEDVDEEEIERALSLGNEWEEDEEEVGSLMERRDALEIAGIKNEVAEVDLFNPPPAIERINKVKDENDGMFGNGSFCEKVAAIRVPEEVGMDERAVALKRNDEAMELLDEAIVRGKVNTVVMNAGLSSIARTGKLRTALQFYEERYAEVGVRKDTRTHRAMIGMLLKNKRIEEAIKVKEEVLWNGGEVDLETHGMLIHYYGSRGRLEEGMRALEECHRLKGAVPKERFLGVLRGLCIRSRLLDRDGEVNVDSIVGLGSVSSVPKKLSKNFMLKKVQRAKRYDELSDGDKRYYDTLALIEGDPKGWIKRGMGRGFKRNMGKEGRGRGWEIRNKGMGR